MESGKRHIVIKIGAYVILIIGILISLTLFLSAILLLVAMPDATVQRKVTVSLIILAVSILIILATLSIFESMLDVVSLENKLIDLDDSDHKVN